jgi:hypothetical protein
VIREEYTNDNVTHTKNYNAGKVKWSPPMVSPPYRGGGV